MAIRLVCVGAWAICFPGQTIGRFHLKRSQTSTGLARGHRELFSVANFVAKWWPSRKFRNKRRRTSSTSENLTTLTSSNFGKYVPSFSWYSRWNLKNFIYEQAEMNCKRNYWKSLSERNSHNKHSRSKFSQFWIIKQTLFGQSKTEKNNFKIHCNYTSKWFSEVSARKSQFSVSLWSTARQAHCTTCWKRGRKSPLSDSSVGPSRSHQACTTCTHTKSYTETSKALSKFSLEIKIFVGDVI